ncbi:TPA: winged helix-turn-helix domain-containing protein [Enterobacter roggenkampii]|nr:winged helix-turn-helix domain-containing protein [Enterobacter roggenkampii]
MFYIIDSRVEFHPEKNLLIDLQSKKEVSLFAPASLCFQGLIENQGGILKQKELMHIGWESRGLSVSPNAFYQNISHIRRSLADIIPDKEIIRTVKRSGWIIESTLAIEKVSSSVAKNLTADVTHNTLSNAPMSHRSARIGSWKYLLAFVTFFITFINIGYGINELETKKVLFKDYRLEKKMPGGCEIYVNNDSGILPSDYERLKKPQEMCKGFDKVFVTQWERMIGFSLALCSYPPGSSHSGSLICTTEYYEKDWNKP